MVYTRQTKNYRRRRPVRKRAGVRKNAKAIQGIKQSLKQKKNSWGLAHEARSSSFGDSIVPIFPAAISCPYSPAWSNWGPDSKIAELAGRCNVGNVRIGMQFTAYTELDPVTFQVSHIKLVPATAATTIEDQTRTLSGIGSDAQYTMRGAFSGVQGVATTNAHVTYNGRIFEVKKTWKFTLGGALATSPAQQISTSMHDSIKNIDYTVNMGRQVLGSPNGTFLQLDADAYRNENLNYISIMTDQSSLDTANPAYSLIMSCVCDAQE